MINFKFRQQAYLVSIKKGFTLFCLFFFILFCVLGVWQLHRYHYKKLLLVTYQQRLKAPPKPLPEVLQENNDKQYQRVVVKGRYLDGLTLLLQNQYNKGRVGFDVLTPVKIPRDHRLLLVDRGWIASEHDLLPHSTILTEQYIVGYIKQYNEYQFTLGKNSVDEKKVPLVMQKIDFNELSRITHQEFYPFVIRLDTSLANGFERDWVIVSVLPERHMGYAIQWFVMAFVLLIACFCFNCERIENEK